MDHQASVKKDQIPEGWSLEAADFINKCLQRRPAIRLGANGPKELKQHNWLIDTDWKLLIEKKLTAPFIPDTKIDNFELKPTTHEETPGKVDDETDEYLLEKSDVQNLFSGYYFNITENLEKGATKSTHEGKNSLDE